MNHRTLICKCNPFFCGALPLLKAFKERQLEAGRIDSHIRFLGWCCWKLSGLL